MLPPGRFQLVTSPSWTGSVPVPKTMGIVVVAAWGRERRRGAARSGNYSYLSANQIGCQCG